jgi:hypothetical protein
MFSYCVSSLDLLVIQLKAAIRRVLDTKGVRARVLDKVNRYGEVVIGVILERPGRSDALRRAGSLDAEDSDAEDSVGDPCETSSSVMGSKASDTSPE